MHASTVFVTGGAGFIGSALVRHLINHTEARVVNVDALSYAGDVQRLQEVADHPRYHFEQHNVSDAKAMAHVLQQYQPQLVMHLAAETHVDRSIADPQPFIVSNVLGTYTLLEQTRAYWQQLPPTARDTFRFHHISTDEVYGDLAAQQAAATETSPYFPSSPYAASKASADHLVHAWHRTYGLPLLMSHCSNNYGPYQYPEKLIPRMIQRALAGETLPVYGDGQQVRDWLFVEDHVRALLTIATRGVPGQRYNIGGNNEHPNLEVVGMLCDTLQALRPPTHGHYRDRIRHVADRPGHDRRYAVNASKIHRELGWKPRVPFVEGLHRTIAWYLAQVEQ